MQHLGSTLVIEDSFLLSKGSPRELPYRSISVHFQIFTLGTSSLAPYFLGGACRTSSTAGLYRSVSPASSFRCTEGGDSLKGYCSRGQCTFSGIGTVTLGHAVQSQIWRKIWFGGTRRMLMAVFQQPRPSSKVLWR